MKEVLFVSRGFLPWDLEVSVPGSRQNQVQKSLHPECIQKGRNHPEFGAAIQKNWEAHPNQNSVPMR
jgi:hypothetical protein